MLQKGHYLGMTRRINGLFRFYPDQSERDTTTMFDSDEEFEARVGQGPSEILEQFLEGLPSTLRDSAVPLKHFTKEGFLAQGSFGESNTSAFFF